MSDRSIGRQGMQVRYRSWTLDGAETRSFRRRRLACLGSGVASLVLMLVAFVLQVVEGSWFPVLTTAAAFVLQVQVCDTTLASCTIRAQQEGTCPQFNCRQGMSSMYKRAAPRGRDAKHDYQSE